MQRVVLCDTAASHGLQSVRSLVRALVCIALLPLVGCATRVQRDLSQMTSRVESARVKRTVETLAGFGTRNTMSSPDHATRGIGAARRWLVAEFEAISRESGGRLVVSEDAFDYGPDGNRITRPTRIVNVVATLPGLQPESADRLIVVSGHYDSMCNDPKDPDCDAPGADDDASGVAAVLEAARVMSRERFDATIVFLAVAGEEQGLLGSKHWAGAARAANRDVAAMITNDIVGASRGPSGIDHTQRLRLFSAGVAESETPEQARLRVATGSENDSPSRQIARFIDEQVATHLAPFDTVLVFRRDRYLRGGDHIPFLQAGYPAVRFTEYEENYDHQHQTPRFEDGREFGDWPRYCDFDYVARVARANVVALAALARAPAAPKNVRIVTAKLAGNTTLRWDANREPDVAGYEVVWRDTTAAIWEHTRDAGRATELTLPISKDNVHFGVRAVDRDGYRGPVAAATAARE